MSRHRRGPVLESVGNAISTRNLRTFLTSLNNLAPGEYTGGWAARSFKASVYSPGPNWRITMQVWFVRTILAGLQATLAAALLMSTVGCSKTESLSAGGATFI